MICRPAPPPFLRSGQNLFACVSDDFKQKIITNISTNIFFLLKIIWNVCKQILATSEEGRGRDICISLTRNNLGFYGWGKFSLSANFTVGFSDLGNFRCEEYSAWEVFHVDNFRVRNFRAGNFVVGIFLVRIYHRSVSHSQPWWTTVALQCWGIVWKHLWVYFRDKLCRHITAVRPAYLPA